MYSIYNILSFLNPPLSTWRENLSQGGLTQGILEPQYCKTYTQVSLCKDSFVSDPMFQSLFTLSENEIVLNKAVLGIISKSCL